MKLWQKIFLWTLLIVMLSVSTIGILLLKNDFHLSLKRQTENTISEHKYMISNINNRIIAERLQSNSILLSTKEIINIMNEIFEHSNTKETTVIALLNTYDEMVYNNSRIDIDTELLNQVKEVNRDDDKILCTQIAKNDGDIKLLVASSITLEQQDYIFVTSTNITDIYDSYTNQLEYSKLLCISLSLVCAFFLLILVKLLLRPLANLNNTTHAIASGDYGKRIKIKRYDELGELAENMNIMADSVEENIIRLQETAENRKQFINNLSHEMKTPLTSILGFADIIRIKRNISPEKLSEYSGIIFEEAKRLKNLSGKLMEIITIGETNLDFIGVNTRDLFAQIELVMKPIFSNHQMTLVSECDECMINIDLELFKSMIFNIVDNSIKASKKEANIYLKGIYEDNIFEISIIDNGIGIDEKELGKITEPFYMIDKARSRKAGGAGLGLALCKRIAEIHDADFEIYSKLGAGTTIKILIKGAVCDEEF